jgi:two-component system NtrC family sensor kinase
LGLSIYHQFSVSYTAKIMESIRTLAENRRNAIDLFLDERVSQLNTLAYTHSFERLKEEEDRAVDVRSELSPKIRSCSQFVDGVD